MVLYNQKNMQMGEIYAYNYSKSIHYGRREANRNYEGNI